MAGNSPRKQSKPKEDEEELSTGAKIGLGMAGAAAVGGAAYLLYKLFSDEGENAQMTTTPATAVQPKKLQYSGTTAQRVLEEVNARIKLQQDVVTERNVFIRNLIRTSVIDGLCNDSPLFNKLYQDILWTGSFYEGLKISAPDEYDLNIILALPVKQHELEVTTKGALPAYACINNFKQALENLKASNHPHWDIYSKMLQWCDEKGSLRQDKIRYWLQSLLDKYLSVARPRIINEYGLDSLTVCESGPARTLKMRLSGSKEISIDLVPAIEFKASTPQPPPFRKLPYTFPWYAVPKPKDAKNSVWRLSFCLHEKQMIHDLRNIKPAIRLIKKLRDTHNWDAICSYFIKTVAYWEIHNDKNKIYGMKLDQLFLHLLKELQRRVEENDLKSYWDARYNLLEPLPETHRQQIAKSMKKIITEIEKNLTTNPAIIGQLIDPI